jgi:hypothetical protein
MDVLAERLDKKLREWSPETAEQVRCQIDEIIELADRDLLDIGRSRTVEQEVLDLLDEPTTQNRASPYEVMLPKARFLAKDSFANVQGIGSLPTVRLDRRIGALPTETINEIKKAIAWTLELDV